MFDYWESPETNRNYKLKYCDLCNAYIIICEDCNNSSCNGGSCELCFNDFYYFSNKFQWSLWHNILSEEEYKVFEKIDRYKDFILASIKINRDKLDLKEIRDNGLMSEYAEDLFKGELSKL